MKNRVSVIIPTKNGGVGFQQTLEAIFLQEIDFHLEVIIIDSGSTDQTLKICGRYPVKLIEIPAASFHHSSTRNYAISQATGDICVLTVQDALPVNKKWLAKLVEPLLKNKRIGGVFGQQVSRVDASSYSKCCKLLWYRQWRDDWNRAHEQLPVSSDEWDRFSPEKKRTVARFDNVNGCVRRSVWQKIPFPDVPYAEDVAWAIAVLTSGFSIFWQPSAQVLHSHDRSLAYEFQRTYVDVKNMAMLLDGSAPPVTFQGVGSVIRWLAMEAVKYLKGADGKYSVVGQDLELIARADKVWQTEVQAEKVLMGKKPSHGSNASLGTTSLKDFLLAYYYGGVSGPKWFRIMCRNLFRQGWLISKKKNSASSDVISLAYKLRGSHRYFLNQLLQVYHDNFLSSRESIQSIRLASAVAVAGSFLGQYLHVLPVDSTGITDDEKSGYLSARPCNHSQLWQVLADWEKQQFYQETNALLMLDKLLVHGI